MARAADGLDFHDGVGEQCRVVEAFIGELMNEAGVRSIFQQPADEIGQQILVPTDWRIDAAMITLVMNKPLVKTFAHAVESLELEVAAFARPFEDRRHRKRVMRRKGRIDVLGSQHVLRAGEPGNIGCGLAGK